MPICLRVEVHVQHLCPACGLHKKLAFRNQLGKQLDLPVVELEHALVAGEIGAWVREEDLSRTDLVYEVENAGILQISS